MEGKNDNPSQFALFPQTTPPLAPPPPAVHPFIKWVGGKGKLFTQIQVRLPWKIEGTYREPFLGGGAAFFGLVTSKRITKAVLSDTNGELINAYSTVRDDVELLIAALGEHRYQKEHYYAVRATDPRTLSPIEQAARFIYLNRTCFNGLYRLNRSGASNVPMGRYKNPIICNPAALRLASSALKLADLRETDFASQLAEAAPGDAVYLDPPYVPASPTAKFTEYTAKPFDDAEQVRLRDAVCELERRGVHFLVSNSCTPRVRELYASFRQDVVHAPRAVNSKPSARGAVEELLISSPTLALPKADYGCNGGHSELQP